MESEVTRVYTLLLWTHNVTVTWSMGLLTLPYTEVSPRSVSIGDAVREVVEEYVEKYEVAPDAVVLEGHEPDLRYAKSAQVQGLRIGTHSIYHLPVSEPVPAPLYPRRRCVVVSLVRCSEEPRCGEVREVRSLLEEKFIDPWTILILKVYLQGPVPRSWVKFSRR